MKRTFLTLLACVLAVSMLASGCAKEKKAVSTDGETITMFAGFGKAEASKADSAFIEKVEEATGVKLEFIIPPSSSYSERLNIMLASGDYPDVIGFNDLNGQAFLNAVEQKIIIPIDEYLKDAPSIMKHTYDYSWDALKVGEDRENIYGVPRSSLTRNDGYAVRADWLENLGIEIPEDRGVSLELFTEILRRFTEDDPDGNGKNDTYGTFLSRGGNKNLLPMALPAFDCHGWQEYDNEPYKYMNPIYSQTNSNYKEALAYTREVFAKGYIDPASTSYTGTDATDKFLVRNEVGLRRAFAGHVANYRVTLKKNNPDAELEFFYLENKDGEIVGTGTADSNGGDTGFWGHWSVTSACKNPAAAIKVLDWMLSDEGWDYTMKGVEGVEYNNVDGIWVDADLNDGAAWRPNFVRRAANAEYFGNTYRLKEEERNEILSMIQIGIDTVKPTLDRGFVPPASKEINYMNYSMTMEETVSKIIIGNIPVSEYDKALEGWYKNGGEDYVKQMNEYIASLAKTK